MRKRLGFMFIPALSALIASLIMVSLYGYKETGRCYRNGSMLSAEELRTQTIKSLLTAEMESSRRSNKYKTYVKTFLIQQSWTSDDVKDAVLSNSISNLQKEATYPINSDQDIERVPYTFLQSEFSIIQYGAGNVRIIPSRSIEAIDINIAKKNIAPERKKPFKLNIFERALGYGNKYFTVEVFAFIDLACCEEIYIKYPKAGKAPEWYAGRIIDSIITGEQPIRRHLITSNCGDILHRSEDDYVWYTF